MERYLSGIDYILAKPDGSGFETLTGASADAWRQRIETMRSRYLEGTAISMRGPGTSSRPISRALREAQQDAILHEVEQAGRPLPMTLAVSDQLAGPVSGEPALQQTLTEVDLDFLPLLVTHTRQGFYADPIYGGNRDRVGWTVIGFPGPTSLQRGP